MLPAAAAVLLRCRDAADFCWLVACRLDLAEALAPEEEAAALLLGVLEDDAAALLCPTPSPGSALSPDGAGEAAGVKGAVAVAADVAAKLGNLKGDAGVGSGLGTSSAAPPSKPSGRLCCGEGPSAGLSKNARSAKTKPIVAGNVLLAQLHMICLVFACTASRC